MTPGLTTPLPLRTSVLRGLGWLTGAQSARQALQLLIRVLLVRLLAPDDFGLLAMVTAVSGFLLMFNDFGLGPALVRAPAVSEVELSTVFWLNAATGLILALAMAALGPTLARFYSQPLLATICLALALGSLMAPLGTVHNALLQRRMDFRSLAKIDVVGIAAGGVVGVTLALRGVGVWALVWQSNVNVLAVLAVTLLAARWAPRRCFDRAAIAGLWKFSGSFTASTALNYCLRNLDNLLVGRFLGAAALGFYSQAYQMMLYPVQNVAALAGRVMFPALASVHADRERVRRAYLQALRGIAALTFPLMLGAMVLAPELYRVLYGRRWERSVFLFQVLCAVGMVQSISTTTGWIYLARGRTDLLLRWTLIAAGVVLPAFVLGLRWRGLEGLTFGYAMATGLVFLPSLIMAFRLIQLPVSEAARRLAPLLAAAVGMAACVLVLRWSLLPVAGPAVRLILGIVLGVGVYPVLLHALRQSPLTRARAMWSAWRS